jgi:hypothetical protein
MSYFADLTPHTYTPTRDLVVLNIGWLDTSHPFSTGETPAAFHESLLTLCKRPVIVHRGFHVCQFCPQTPHHLEPEVRGNGVIRVGGKGNVWYAAPTMIHHYVTAHAYKPPQVFIDAVMRAAASGENKQ